MDKRNFKIKIKMSFLTFLMQNGMKMISKKRMRMMKKEIIT